MKNIRIFYMKIFQFLVVKFSIYLNRRVFVMSCWPHEMLLEAPLTWSCVCAVYVSKNK